MPILHLVVLMTIVALLLVFAAGLNWLYVAVGYALVLLIVIALYRRA